jgi:hypothetical protein
MNNAIQILPRSFKTLEKKYHDYHTRRLRITSATQQQERSVRRSGARAKICF